MTLSRSRIAAAALFAVGVAEVVIAVGCGFASDLSWLELNNLLVMSNATIGLTLSAAGWLIAGRRPRNPIGWLLLAGGISYASTAAGITALACVPTADRADPWWRLVATATNTGWTWALTLFLPLSLMLFPDGRLPSRRWRPLLILPAVGAPILGALGMLFDFSLSVGVSGYGANHALLQYGWPGAVAAIAIMSSYVGALACLLVRFRHGTEQVRRQLLWVLLALLLVVTTFVLDPLLPDSTFLLLTIALVPVAIGVAVLRHQLLDIRVVFSRSLLYLLLTAGVIAVYLIVVAVLDQVVRSQVALGSSVLATLLVVVAFNPLRVWVQRLVNRAVYGAREDPVRAMAAVGARLSEVGDQHGDGLVEVLASLCQVMRFPYGTITVQGRDVASVGRAEPPAPDTTSPVHVTQLTWGEESVGKLVVGLRPGETKVAAADRQVLDLLAGPIAVAVRAGLLSAELSRSREQVITAREEERRRLRRDLHDGLGPVLTGVVLNAEAALRLVEADPQRSAELISALRDQTSGALTDIRRLVYDLRPPALDSLGLIGALKEYAMLLTRRADGQPLAVTVRATVTIPELPAAVEVAAYRIVTEALTNVTRHSNATSATVTVAVDDSALVVAVHDDGVNVGGGWQPGVGLTSIRERAAELGGQCTIATDRTGGRVDVRLPIPAGSRVGPVPGDRRDRRRHTMSLRIVVADDHTIVQEGLRALLSTVDGYELVEVTRTGEEAVRAAVSQRPDVRDHGHPDAGHRRDRGHPPDHQGGAGRRDLDADHVRRRRVGVRRHARRCSRVRAEGCAPGHHDQGDRRRRRRRGHLQRRRRPPRPDLPHDPAPRRAPFPELTPREREVLELIAGGMSNAAIAARFGLAVSTVSNHISSIFAKLQVATRAEAIVRARDAGL